MHQATELTPASFIARALSNPVNAELLQRLKRAPGWGVHDHDVFYFDGDDLSWEAEDRLIQAVQTSTTRVSLTEEPLAERSWRRAWAALGVQAPLSVMTQLLDAYAESQRHYHSLQHLRECLTHLESALALAQRPAIYSTDLFRERFEAHVRENLRRAIGTLAG